MVCELLLLSIPEGQKKGGELCWEIVEEGEVSTAGVDTVMVSAASGASHPQTFAREPIRAASRRLCNRTQHCTGAEQTGSCVGSAVERQMGFSVEWSGA